MTYLIAAVVLVLALYLIAKFVQRTLGGAPVADADTPAHAEETPFGEDIAHPDARVIPAPLTGRWTAQGMDTALVIEPGLLRFGDEEEQVVAVRFIADQPDLRTTENVAVVTRVPGGAYALHMLGLSRDGGLVDLENMDFVLARAA